MSHKTEYIWTCKIGGPAIQFQSGADAPMRQAVQAAFKQVTGNDEVFCFSGWGGELTEPERAVVENRLPSDEHEAEWNRRAAVQAAQPEAVIAWMHAESERIAAVHEYNAAHEAAKKYDFGAVDLNPHYQRMTEKANAAHRLLAPMHAALLASAPTPEPMSAPTAGPSDADWADFGAWAERDKGAADMLEKLIDVWDDGQLPHEHRCYVDGAWSELIAEARSLLAAAPTEAKPAQQDAVDARLVYASPIFTTAIDALNKVKAWRDCDGNDGFPHDVREQIDAVLMAYEIRAAISAKKGQP